MPLKHQSKKVVSLYLNHKGTAQELSHVIKFSLLETCILRNTGSSMFSSSVKKTHGALPRWIYDLFLCEIVVVASLQGWPPWTIPWVFTSLYKLLSHWIWVGLATVTQKNAIEVPAPGPTLRKAWQIMFLVLLGALSYYVKSPITKVVRPCGETTWRGEALQLP